MNNHNAAKEATQQQAEINKAMRRRLVVAGGLGTLVTGGLGMRALAAMLAPGQTAQSKPGQAVSIENFATSGKSLGVVQLQKLVKNDADWRGQLSGDAYDVTRHAGTERPFTGKYWNNHADGLYRCICCNTTLFDSSTKFESGTGWPSFWQSISAHNVIKSVDNSYGMERDAISCGLCDAHLGHVFDDGPRPTGLRYCMNSVALQFVARG